MPLLCSREQHIPPATTLALYLTSKDGSLNDIGLRKMDTITYYLSWRPWFTVPAVLVLGVFLCRRISLIYQLRHIKGPLLYRFTGIPHALALLSGDSHNWYAELHRKYGT